MKSIYITKELEDVTQLKQFCAFQNIDLHAQSQLNFEAVPFTVTEPFEVVFFSSVRAGRFFLRSYDGPLSSLQFACIGEETAQKFNIEFAFVGKEAGNPEKVAEKFKNWLGDKRLLIPHSSLSHKTIAETIPSSQCESVCVYNTLLSPQSIPESEVYVFTSPSNLAAFLQKNQVPESAKVIAWGNTTEKALRNSKVQVSKTLNKAQLEELLEVLANF
jgi:uroporphyrinogen-III synthase